MATVPNSDNETINVSRKAAQIDHLEMGPVLVFEAGEGMKDNDYEKANFQHAGQACRPFDGLLDLCRHSNLLPAWLQVIGQPPANRFVVKAVSGQACNGYQTNEGWA